MKEENIYDFFIDNLRKFFFPEELIALDFALSKVELLTLLSIDRHGEIIMSQIADYIAVPLSTATGVIDRLVKNGYLERERSDSDRRIVTVHLADKGQQIIDQFKDKILIYMANIQNALTDDEKNLLYKLILKIMDILQKTDLQKTDPENSRVRAIPIE